MNIFKFAMDMEKDGKNYYKQLASKTNNEGLQKILNMLIDDEVKHYNVIKKMSESALKPFDDTKILANAKNVFSELKLDEEIFDLHLSQKKLYQKAQEIEKKSEDFYKEKSKELGDAKQKEIFLKIAEEEKKHYFLLEKIIEFVSRPDTWIENAEFNHLDEY